MKKMIFLLLAPFFMLLVVAPPAWAHSAVLKVSCQEGTITWNLNPDTPDEGPVKVTSIDGPTVKGLAVGDTVPDEGVTFTSKQGGKLTIGMEWKKDRFEAKASNTYDGTCESSTTTTMASTTTTTLLPCVVNCTPPCQSSNQPGCGPTTTTLPPTTTTIPPTTTTKPPATTTTVPPTTTSQPPVVAPSVTPAATLPHTGSSTMVLGLIGTVLMLGGFLLVWLNCESLGSSK